MKILYDDSPAAHKDVMVKGKWYTFYRAQTQDVPDEVGKILLTKGFRAVG
jgi:hypothetical protein